MPSINVKVAADAIAPSQVAAIQKGITCLMVDVLRKRGPLVSVLVEQVSPAGWSVGAEPVSRAAHVDAIVSAGTNTPAEKIRFVAEANQLLRTVLGPDLSPVTYVVVREVPMDSWGYDGLTQAHRANTAPVDA